MSPLVSVVIPTYNHAHFLGRALQSVIDQDYQNWEALVIDNHSLDDTDNIIKSFNDPRIRPLKIHNHGVIAASRNMGIREASGEWIAFLDSDDYWYSGKLQLIMSAIKLDSSIDVVSNDELMIDIKTGTKRVLRHGPYQEDFYRTLLIEGNRLSPSATLVRHSFLDQHQLFFDESEDYITVEDYDFWLNLARKGARFKFIHHVQGEFVIHGSNSSTQLSTHLKNSESMLYHHVFDIQEFNSSVERLWALVSTRLRLEKVKLFFKNGKFALALKLMLEALIYSPTGVCVFLYLRFKKILRKISL
jgi:glycosyltransferase involved in cell wall biosynthesis